MTDDHDEAIRIPPGKAVGIVSDLLGSLPRQYRVYCAADGGIYAAPPRRKNDDRPDDLDETDE